MDLLAELTFLFTDNRPKSFAALLPENTKTRQLFDAVIGGKVTTDEEAAKYIYQSLKTDKKYLMLKRNLINKLFELVLVSEHKDISSNNNFIQVQLDCILDLIVAEKLLIKNLYHNAEKLLTKVYQTTEKYCMINLQLDCALKLRTMYALMGYPRHTEITHKEIYKLNICAQYVNEARGFWQILESKVKFSNAKSPEIAALAKSYCEIIEPYTIEYESPFLVLFLYRIYLKVFLFTNHFQNLLILLEKFESFLDEYEFLKNRILIIELNYEKARYNLATRDLDSATKCIGVCLKYSNYRTFDKYIIQAMRFNLKIKKKKYNEAGAILQEVYSSEQFDQLNPFDKSFWRMREAYLHFLFLCEKDESAMKKYTPYFVNNFSVSDFMSYCQAATKDKQGCNIQLQIIKVVLMIEKGFSNLEYEGNNMLVYYHRHLKDLIEIRTREFFKAIGKLAFTNCDRFEIGERTEKLFTRLDSLYAEPIYDMNEIIPYEEFWLLILGRLKR